MARILPGLSRKNWSTEALAGITLAAIAIPLNIGYAQIAGLPATAGLYSLIAPAILFALLASTRQLVASPDAAAAALVSSSLIGLVGASSHDFVALAAAQALIGGAMFALCGVLKLGFIANFLSAPILVGFVGGLALDILLSQFAKMIGVKVNSGDDFIPRFGELVAHLDQINLWSVAISAGGIAVLILGRRLNHAVPWALVVLVAATVALVSFQLDTDGVSILGNVPAGPPSLTWPSVSLTHWLQLVPSALALTLVAIAEGLLVARRYAEQNGYPHDPNRDLLAYAAANAGSGITGGFTIGSSASRTAAMDQAGSRSQLPAIVAAVLTFLVVCFGTALLRDIPSPAIGAIVAVAVAPLLGIRDFARLWRLRKFEFAIAAVCFLSALLIGPIAGVLIAFVLSLLNVVQGATRPGIEVLRPDGDPVDAFRAAADGTAITAPGVVIVRFAAPLFFANASRFDAGIRHVISSADETLRHLVLDCEAIGSVDTTAADVVKETFAWVRERDITVSLTRVRAALRSELETFALLDGTTTYGSNRSAVAALTDSSRTE